MTTQNKICVEKPKQYLEEYANFMLIFERKKKHLKTRFKVSTLRQGKKSKIYNKNNNRNNKKEETTENLTKLKNIRSQER